MYLREKGINCEIHLSGECGEVNSRMVAVFDKKIGLKRVIFHRKNTFEDMRAVAEKCEIPEREAFVLNEMCQFTGAFCNSLHCDEMGYLCRVPYELGTIKTVKTDSQKLEKPASDSDEMISVSRLEPPDPAYDPTGYLCGETGCGLCALYQLKQAGITHLKLVGRGNYTDYMEKDIRNLRNALRLLEESGDEAEFKSKLKSGIFPGGCSGNCYYR